MGIWNSLSNLILGDYSNEVKHHKRLVSSYKSEIRRLGREQEVDRVDDFDKAFLSSEAFEAHLDADDEIQNEGALHRGYYQIPDDKVSNVEAALKNVVDVGGSKLSRYTWLKRTRGFIFIIIAIGFLGLGAIGIL